MAKVEKQTLRKYLSGEENFIVPIYQRNYDWDIENIKQLLDDMVNYQISLSQFKGDRAEHVYYLGAIYVVHNYDNTSGIVSRVLVDGQQRITSSLLILAVLLEFLDDDIEKKTRTKEMIYLNSTSQKFNKIKLNRLNAANVIDAILTNRNISQEYKETNIYKNYIFLKEYITNQKKENHNYINLVYQSFSSTGISEVRLDKFLDNPSKIFETVNVTGKPLDDCDLIKNFIFFNIINLTQTEEDNLSKLYESKVELLIGNNKNQNIFFRHLIPILFNQPLPKKTSKNIYIAFKENLIKNRIKLETFDDIKNFIEILSNHAEIYRDISEPKISNKDYKNQLFFNIFNQSKDTFYTLAHNLAFNKKKNSNCDEYYANDIFKLIANYSIYYFICGGKEKAITRDLPNIYNKYIADRKEFISIQDFKSWFTNESNNSCKMKTINDVSNFINLTPVYRDNTSKTILLLKCIELSNSIGGETSSIILDHKTKLTIEHIMPQSANNNELWKELILKINNNDHVEAEKYFNTKLDILPNLTLLTAPLNITISNSSFEIKKEKIINSALSLNTSLLKYKIWDNKTIQLRSEWMLEKLTKLFEN